MTVPLQYEDLHNVPDELKKEGNDWFTVFDPKWELYPLSKDGGQASSARTQKMIDVGLTHTLLHDSVVCAVRFSADGKYLATSCKHTAQIFDTKTGAKICVLRDSEAPTSGDLFVRSICFSPDGKVLVTAAEDKQIRVWDITTRKIKTIFSGHQQEVYTMDFSPDGRFLVSGSGDCTVRVWDMTEDGTHSKVLTIDPLPPSINDAGITSVSISPDSRLVAAGSLDSTVRIWDILTGRLINHLKDHKDAVYDVVFTPDGTGLISGSLDNKLKYWDIRPVLDSLSSPVVSPTSTSDDPSERVPQSQRTLEFVGHTDFVLGVAVSPDGRWVFSGSKDRTLRIWDAMTAAEQCMVLGHKNSVISVHASPTGNMVATGSGDWQARIWYYEPL